MTERPDVLVVALDGVRPPVLETVTLARTLGDPVLVSPAPLDDDALAALGEAGVRTAIVVDLGDAAFAPARLGAAVARAAESVEADTVLLPTSFAAKEVAAHVAHRLGAGLLLDVATLQRQEEEGLVGGKRVFAGTWETSCAVTAPTAVVTLRANVVTATAAPTAVTTDVVALDADATLPAGQQLLGREVHDHAEGRPPLAEAAYVVAGGRGTEGDFAGVEDLADALGAAVGTTRDCVDEGWQPHDSQIGQTGVTVAPRLYIGAGISGAPHHHGGMQASGTIVAVNADADAPLVQIADFAVIGDLQEILPAAAEAIRAHRDG